MRRAFTSSLIGVLLLLIAISCRSGGDLSKPETQRQFGIRMAKMNLWREAMFRFKRAVDIDPDNATAHNNLAVAFEANGDFENAAKEYREALRLDRSNQYIQKNYSRFVEFTQRGKKRDAKTAAGTPATTTAKPQPKPPVTMTGEPMPMQPPPPVTSTLDTTGPTSTNPPEGGAR